MANNKIKLTREELYKLVWESPLTTLAPRYGLSDNGLRKICIKHKIPLPKAGHWAKYYSGKDLIIEKLPVLEPEESIHLGKISIRKLQNIDNDLLDEVIEFENNKDNHIVLKDKLINPHRLIQNTKYSLDNKRLDKYSRMIQCGKGCLNLKVTPVGSQRALLILDSLINAMEKRPYIQRIYCEDTPSLCVEMFGETLRLAIKEKVDKLPKHRKINKRTISGHVFNDTIEYHGTGELTLYVETWCDSTQVSWSDTKHMQLEDRLNEFIIGLAKVALVKKADRTQQEEEKRIQQEKANTYIMKKRKELFEQAKLDRLADNAQQHNDILKIRNYIKSIEKNYKENKLVNKSDVNLEEWLAWAYKSVDESDPSLNFSFIRFEDFNPEIRVPYEVYYDS